MTAGLAFIGVLAAGLPVFSMTVTTKDVPGEYVSNGPMPKIPLLLEMKKDGSFVAHPKSKGGPELSGKWAIKDNQVQLTLRKESCAFHYRPDLSFDEGARVGSGLVCVDPKKKQPAFCACLMEKQTTN